MALFSESTGRSNLEVEAAAVAVVMGMDMTSSCSGMVGVEAIVDVQKLESVGVNMKKLM